MSVNGNQRRRSRLSCMPRGWSILDGYYYIPTRYPNGLPDGIPADVYTQKAAADATGLAGEAVDLVATLLAGQQEE